jgi:serralysin
MVFRNFHRIADNADMFGTKLFQNFQGTANNDIINGTNNADFFNMSQGGDDDVFGKDGADIFSFGSQWSLGDEVNGGTGNDVVRLGGGGTKIIAQNGLTSVETIELGDSGDYTITFLSSGKNDNLTVDGSDLSSSNFMTVDAGNEEKRAVTLLGGRASDHLTGGQDIDHLKGDRGLDFIDGEGGADIVVYTDIIQSTGINCDHVTYDGKDKFDLGVIVNSVQDILRNKFNGTTARKFNDNLEEVVDGAELPAFSAVVLDVNQGDWSGHDFLIVDANGSAGFQADEDYVIEIIGGHLGQIDVDSFVN